MTKKTKNIYNLIVSILFAFVLAQMVIFEGYIVLVAEQQKNGIPDVDITVSDMSTYKILAFIMFISIIAIFNTKRFKKVNLNKISVYLILVVIISIIAAIEGMLVLSTIIFKFYPSIIDYLSNNFFIIGNVIYIYFLIGISLFLITFILLVNMKVKYIKFLTREVKIIKSEGFGKTIKVKGGDELAELCESINDMSVELGKKIENEKKIEQNKNELITNISHDLKTPLTSIVGYLELLNREDLDEETRNEYINIAYNKSLRLKSLVNELFEYTKLTGNDIILEKSKINIAMLLNQAVGESIINFMDKDIEVVIDNPYSEVFSYIDPIQILRVFENLIKNVEKYGDANSVFQAALKVEEEKIIITFTNKCKDIKDDNIDRIFDKFYREDKSRHKEGSGLGLAIVKRIIELHDGSISVEKIDDNIKFDIMLNKA